MSHQKGKFVLSHFLFLHAIYRLHIKLIIDRFSAFACPIKCQNSLILPYIRLHVIYIPRPPMRSCCWAVTLATLSSMSLKLNLSRSVHFSTCESCAVLKPRQSSAQRVLTLLVLPARMPSHGCPQTVLCHWFADTALGWKYLSFWVSLFATGSANPQQIFGRAKHRGSTGPCSERYQHFAHD